MLTRFTSLFPIIGRVFVAALLSLALTAVSFGHQPPQDDARAEAYLLAGGDWAAICADSGAPLHGAELCMACLISAGAGLPGAVTGPTAQISARLVDWAQAAGDTLRRQRVFIHPARAPPARDRSYNV
ncbi:hypothetical protein [Yoonia sp.]|uniref:hypothetical protein n=1 Tax=Yoonia sp. TaxID=2212373 RepID=UPI0039197DAA